MGENMSFLPAASKGKSTCTLPLPASFTTEQSTVDDFLYIETEIFEILRIFVARILKRITVFVLKICTYYTISCFLYKPYKILPFSQWKQ